jgi:peptide/nickel transport system permease protein
MDALLAALQTRPLRAREPDRLRPALKRTLPVTWSIVLGGVILLFVIALPLATISALRANTAVDRIILTATIAGVALHPFIIGIGLRGLFANRLGWLPAYHYCPLRGTTVLTEISPGVADYNASTCGGLGGWSSHLALPWMTFAVIFVPLYVRMLRGAMVEVLEAPYILTAHAKGAGTLRVLRSHVFRTRCCSR